jgi:dipeptidase E
MELDPANGFIERLRADLPQPARTLFICSSPDEPERTERFAGNIRLCFEKEGFAFSRFDVLDRRTQANAGELVRAAELIILAGGHVPTQNRFFHEIGLRKLLCGFGGVLIGVSAGSMNSAETVYAHPERDGEATDPGYRRFLTGLGLTKQMILPHYQLVKYETVDGLRAMEDVAYPDSMGRQFIAMPDGSYILIDGDGERLFGEAWSVADGALTKLCAAGESVKL